MDDSANYKRWANLRKHHRVWHRRTKRIACLIPESSSVFEFGAGAQAIKRYLKSTQRYTPCDLVPRCEQTFVCNLNERPLPIFPNHDVAVFGGVLEYVNDVQSLLNHLVQSFPKVIASYSVTEFTPDPDVRRAKRWKNDYSSKELALAFTNAGYNPERILRWRRQKLFICERNSA